ncbi:MAG TPA: sugar ABC transporter permease [bacterium]|nr:sugar ABC transporter permease [bacterium]HOH07401.1 sugar ABC transporter permease [bacterium]HOY43850.1 sugar ABC transporter permease [bacterium]HPG84273.1 sugar ABC transporter permease [bacterium]HPM59254.1 sugar ABC transporter permease [bacterium]
MKHKWLIPWFFLAPALGTLLLFFFLPVLASLLMSFSDFDIYALGNLSRARWNGLENYGRLLHDPLFWKALGNTVYFVLAGGPLTILAALLAAIGLNSRQLMLRDWFRLGYFTPVITSLVAVAVVWRYLYHPRFGLFNYLLSFAGVGPVNWLGDPVWAMPALILLAVWKNFGYYMMIFLAGLQTIPDYLYEAARLDGAGWWGQFRHVTLPQLAPTTFFVTLMTIIGYFQFFAEPYVMTQGGPVNSTLSVVFYLYQQGFRWWRMGYASSIAFMLFFIIFLLAMLQMAARRRQEAA